MFALSIYFLKMIYSFIIIILLIICQWGFMPICFHCYNKIPETNQLKGGKAYLGLTVSVVFFY